MTLVEDHEVVETLAPDRTDYALDVSVLPRGAWRRDDFRYAHRLDPAAEVRAIRCVTVAQQISGRRVPPDGSLCSVTAVRTIFLRT